MPGQPPLPKRDLEAEGKGEENDDAEESDQESDGEAASQETGSSGTLVGEDDDDVKGGKKTD